MFCWKVGGDMNFIVNNHIWHLQFVKGGSENLRRSDGSYTFGVTDNSVKTVFLMRNMSDYMTERVICHELTHCICFEYGISIPLETEEWLCNFMADHGKEIIYLLDDLLSFIVARRVI